MAQEDTNSGAAVVTPPSVPKEEEKPTTTTTQEDTTAPKEPAAPAAPQEDPEDDDPEKEVTSGPWKLPQVKVEEVDVKLGEEGEEVVWSHRALLYRWNAGQWKQRGLGDAKLLKDEENRIRFILRQEKTLKICANHYVVPEGNYCSLTTNAGNDKIWVWTVVDCAEEPYEREQFGLRFGTTEAAKEFKDAFEKAAKENKALFDDGKFGDLIKKKSD